MSLLLQLQGEKPRRERQRTTKTCCECRRVFRCRLWQSGWSSARDHRSDFDPILIQQHLVFSGQFVPTNDQVRFGDEIQFPEQILDSLWSFDFNRAYRMIQLHMHGRMITGTKMEGQGVMAMEKKQTSREKKPASRGRKA